MAVVQPTPYWNESDSESDVWVSFSKTKGSGSEKSSNAGIGGHINVSMSTGAGLFDNKVTMGFDASISAAMSYLYSKSEETSKTDTVTLIIKQGRDYGEYYTAVMGVPMVRYNYNMWRPEYKATEEYIEEYNKVAKEKMGDDAEPFGYKAGETVPGQFEDFSIDEYGQSTYGSLSLSEYNEIAANSDGAMEVVSEDIYPQVTQEEGDELRFQWQKFDTLSFKWEDIDGAYASEYTVHEADLKEGSAGFYRVIVTHMYGSRPMSTTSMPASVRYLPKNTAANDGGEEAILVPEMKVTAGDEKDGKRTVDITVTGEKGVAAGSITLIWGEETKTVDLDKKGRASITVEGLEGQYQIYYSGGKAGSGITYLPAMTDSRCI